MNIPKDQVCIVGSSVLTIRGLRDNHDIDFVMSSSYRKPFGSNLYKINNHIDLVTQDWARSCERKTISDDILIRKSQYHTVFHNFKFASMELLYDRKKWQAREKDIADVRRIEEYWNRTGKCS